MVSKVPKLLISDFENTLIDQEEAIPLSTMLCLDKVRSKGNYFSVFSECSFSSLIAYNRDFPFLDYIILFNGAFIYDVNAEKEICKDNIPLSIIKKIKKSFDNYNLCFYSLDWCNYTKEEVPGDFVRKIGDFRTFSSFHKDNIFKIRIYCSSKKEQTSIVSELKELKLDLTILPKKDKKYFVELLYGDCSRLNAVKLLCNYNKIKFDDIVFLGYSDDNIPLAKKIKDTYAVANGDSKLKKVVNHVTGSNYEKAIESVIDECF